MLQFIVHIIGCLVALLLLGLTMAIVMANTVALIEAIASKDIKYVARVIAIYVAISPYCYVWWVMLGI